MRLLFSVNVCVNCWLFVPLVTQFRENTRIEVTVKCGRWHKIYVAILMLSCLYLNLTKSTVPFLDLVVGNVNVVLKNN